MVDYQYIFNQAGLLKFLDEIAKETWIAYDTEFISEGRYQPELCLVQVATSRGDYILDALRINDMTPFWERICKDDITTIAHACRSELEFCYRAVHKLPPRIFDVQLAAAFIGMGYPLSLKKLAQEIANVKLEKTETLTDWRIRPLLNSQIQYALDDVRHLKKMSDSLTRSLEKAGRQGWYAEEIHNYCEELKKVFDEEGWRRISGSKRCSRDELSILRELWRWRRDKARARNLAPSKVFRDDLILAVAKQKTVNPERIAVIRGIRGLPSSPFVRELAECVAKGLAVPDDEKPETENDDYPLYQIACQLVGVLLTQYCARHNMSYGLFATSLDVRRAIANYEGKLPKYDRDKLSAGWRAEFLGDFLTNVLHGKYAMRLTSDLEGDSLQLLDISDVDLKDAIEK